MDWVPNGIVERVDDGYVGYCHEVGTTAQGRTVEEAFVNLNAATWQVLEQKGDLTHTSPDATDHTSDDVTFYIVDDADQTSAILAAMTSMLVDGMGDYEPIENRNPAA